MAKVPLGKLARAMRLVSSGMGSSGWACRDILILLQLFMKHFLMTFFLYSPLFSFPCPLVRTKFPSRVMDRPMPGDDRNARTSQEMGGSASLFSTTHAASWAR